MPNIELEHLTYLVSVRDEMKAKYDLEVNNRTKKSLRKSYKSVEKEMRRYVSSLIGDYSKTEISQALLT